MATRREGHGAYRPGRREPDGRLVVLAVALAVLALVMSVRALGWLERLELLGHDLVVTQARRIAGFPDLPVVVVGMDEQDKAAHGWPLPDRTLADLLTRLGAMGPRAIGLDFLRGDMAVGPLGKLPDAADAAALLDLLVADRRIVPILDMHLPALPASLAPLAADDRLASPNLSPDHDDVVRRGLLGDVFPDPSVAPEPQLELWSLAASLVRIALVDQDLPPDGPVAADSVPLGRRNLPPLRPGQGPYAADAAVGGGYEFLLSWPLRRLPVVPMRAVLEGSADPAMFRDAIVLVGSIAPSVGDIRTSPLLDQTAEDGLPARAVHGVVAHAQITAQLLAEARGLVTPLRPTGPAWAFAVTAVAALLAAGLGGLVARPQLGLPLLVVGAGLLPVLATVAFAHGWWIAWVPALLAWLLAAGLGFMLVAWRERRQRARLAGMFRTYLPPAVADQLWSGRHLLLEGDRPVPVELPASVLFSDVRGFTTVSERLSPAELLDWLDVYHAMMTEQVAAHGGIVADFMGDGMMAVFGAPIPRTGAAAIDADARSACAAALAIRAALPALGDALAARGLPRIEIRIGIHTGRLIAGAIGGAARLQYTVLGDTVNIAARLESWSSPALAGDPDHCRILVSETTFARVGGQFAGREIGDLQLKGKTRPVKVFRLADPAAAPAALDEAGFRQASTETGS